MTQDIAGSSDFPICRTHLETGHGFGDQNPRCGPKSGMIQFFEMCFELSWNAIKDYLEAQGLGIWSGRARVEKGLG